MRAAWRRLQMIEAWIRELCSPVLRQIPVPVPAGLARGHLVKGALVYLKWSLRLAPEERFLRNRGYTNQVIYDIGASIGTTTLHFAAGVQPHGQVISFEANPSNYDLLADNVRRKGGINVLLFPVAIGDRIGDTEMTLPRYQNATGSIAPHITERYRAQGQGFRTFSVPVRTLDALVKEHQLPDPDFVKIDIEGAEGAALRGMQGILGRAKPDLFLELHDLPDGAEVLGQLVDRGYRVFHIEGGDEVGQPDLGLLRCGHVFCSTGFDPPFRRPR